MKVVVAGKDRTAELGPALSAGAQAMVGRDHAPKMLEEVYTSLSLRDAGNDAEFLDRLVLLLWHKTGVATVGFYMPRKPGPLGWIGAQLRRALWKVLRYQHDRIAYQQNMINTQLTVALEFMHEQYKGHIAELRTRVEELERAAKKT